MLEKYDTLFTCRIEKDALSSHFVLSAADSNSLIVYQSEMLENNRAAGIIHLDVRTKNGETELWYDIACYEPLTDFVDNNKITSKQLLLFLDAAVAAILSSNKLFLTETQFVLAPDTVFVDKNFSPAFLYLPFKGAASDVASDFRELFLFLSGQAVEAPGAGALMQSLSKEIESANFNFKSFHNKIKELRGSREGGMASQANATPISVAAAPSRGEAAPAESAPQMQSAYSSLKEAEKNNESLLKRVDEKDGGGKKIKAEKQPKNKNTGSNPKVILILIQILLVVLFAGLYVNGLLESFDMMQLGGFLVILLAIDYLVVKKILGSLPKPEAEKPAKEAKPQKVKKNKKAKPAVKEVSIDKQQRIKSSEARAEAVPAFALDSSEATVISADEDTVIMEPTMIAYAYLVPDDGGEDARVSVSSNPFTMGKGRQGTDMVCDDKHVSRMHAQIIYEEGLFFLRDLSSTNGTWLNGAKLEANRNYPLTSGDTISLAKTNYAFLI